MNLLDLSFTELQELLVSMSVPKYRAEQIYLGLYSGKRLEEISNLPKSLVSEFRNMGIDGLNTKIVQKLVSKDGTVKYLFELFDGNIIEGVLMRYKYGNTLCVSTQVGCRMGCAFCASGLNGLVRNLSAGEILSEVILANCDQGGNLNKRAVTNIVLMGCGEPLDNYDNVVKFLRLVSYEKGLNVSLRNVSLSTCGIVPKILQLAEEDLQVTLTISLHATDNESREKIMPVNKAYKIEELLDSAKTYFKKTGRRVVFEYAMIKGVNDSTQCADRLAHILKGLSSHVNLIPLNYVKERNLKGIKREEVYKFCEYLNKLGVSATVRRTMGNDIEGACGQLRRKYIGEN